MNRILTDLDFAAYYKQEKAIDKLFLKDLGYESQTASLTPGLMVGRKIYLDPSGQRPHVDIFFDKLNMCHVVSWQKGQLELDKPTISLAHLMLGEASNRPHQRKGRQRRHDVASGARGR